MSDQYWTVAEIAAAIGVTKATIGNWAKAGRLGGFEWVPPPSPNQPPMRRWAASALKNEISNLCPAFDVSVFDQPPPRRPRGARLALFRVAAAATGAKSMT